MDINSLFGNNGKKFQDTQTSDLKNTCPSLWLMKPSAFCSCPAIPLPFTQHDSLSHSVKTVAHGTSTGSPLSTLGEAALYNLGKRGKGIFCSLKLH